jgi:predicted phosphodiesterase
MREIFLSDIHFPHHDASAWHVALKVIQDRKPDIVHLGGDIMDFHSISRHPKQMIERTILKTEVESGRRELTRLRLAAPTAQINYQEGNHDKRLEVFLRDRAPELSDLFELNLPTLLKLADHGIKWIGESEKFKIGKLWHHHGHLLSGGGVAPAKAKFNKLYANIIFGHHHRFDYFSTRQYGTNELFQAVGNANLYTIEADYAHHTNWHIGWTEINYAMPSGDFSVNQIHVNPREDGSSFAIIDGTVYESHPEEDIDKFLKLKARAFARQTAARSSK